MVYLWHIFVIYWPAHPDDPQGIRVASVFETCVCLSVCSLFFVIKFSNFSLFHPSLFIQYSTEECSTVQLLASSLEYPERIRVDSVVETSVPCLLACQQIFSFFPLSSFSFYTVQYRRVQYSTVIGQLPRLSSIPNYSRVKIYFTGLLRQVITHFLESIGHLYQYFTF